VLQWLINVAKSLKKKKENIHVANAELPQTRKTIFADRLSRFFPVESKRVTRYFIPPQ